jgi:hypothetical protein
MSDALTSGPPTAVPATAKPPRRRAPVVVVRDYGFPVGDERREGKGANVPKPNRRLAKRAETGSTISLSSDEEDERGTFDDDDDDATGWGRWGMSFRAWAAGPSQDDLNMGFTGGDDDDESEDAYADDDEYDEYDDFGAGGGEEQAEIIPGLYRALYAFEPEGMAEMRLVEDQIVHVLGRGGGVGWAIAARAPAEGGGHALVPESYLELVKPDAPTRSSVESAMEVYETGGQRQEVGKTRGA